MTDQQAVHDHPATFTPVIRQRLAKILERVDGPILDPMAGIGGIYDLGLPARRVFAIELEPEWAAAHPKVRQGDARDLPFQRNRFAAIVTSCGYGNRMADTYDGRDGTVRHTYRISLGRELSEGNGCAVQWGPRYRAIHLEAWEECIRVLKPGGLFVLNVKDHWRTVDRKRGPERQRVAQWHLETLLGLGLLFDEAHTVLTPGQRQGANGSLRVDGEQILVLSKGN